MRHESLDHETHTGTLVELHEGKILAVYAYIDGVLHYWRDDKGLVLPKEEQEKDV